MKENKLSLNAFVLMILTTVFGVTNIAIAFYRMGYASIPMFIIAGILFFLPFVFMIIEFGSAFTGEKSGMYQWMSSSVTPLFATVGIIMWYSSYIIWMFGKAQSVWQPLSFFLFGKDVTTNELLVGGLNLGPFFIGIAGIVFLIIISYLVFFGPARLGFISAIGGLAVIALNVILIFGGIIVFLVNGFEFQESITLNSFIHSPNVDYQSIIPALGFLVFAVFAYGGTEALAGVSSDLKNPEKNLKKGVLIAAVFIIGAYVIGFLMTGAITSFSTLEEEGVSNSFAALYIVMGQLATQLGLGELGQEIFIRITGLGMFISFSGALIALSYAPLKQLIDGTPKEMWPKAFNLTNKYNIKYFALFVQTLIVIVFITVKSIFSLFDPDGANALYELIISMTNVSMTIPYLFIIYAWYKFKTNDSITKGITLVKSKTIILCITIISFITVAFGNIFTIVSPFLPGESQSIQDGLWTIAGPIIFIILAFILYRNYSNKNI